MERPQQLFFLFGTFGCHNIIISQKNKIQKYQGNAVATMKVPFFIQMLFFYASLRILYVLRIDLCTSPETKPISSVEFRLHNLHRQVTAAKDTAREDTVRRLVDLLTAHGISVQNTLED